MRDVVVGMRFLWEGQRWVFGHRRWLRVGLLPALITLVLYAAVLAVLVWRIDELAAWATPFADDWDSGGRTAVRVAFGAVVMLGALLAAVLTFTAVTLIIGDPFYEALGEAVARDAGWGLPDTGLPWWREMWVSLRDSVRMLLRALAFAVPLFVLGFVPVLGQTVIPVLGFAVSGFFLTAELTSLPLSRHGVPLRDRLRLLRRRLALTLGFGVPLVLAFLIPFVAVLLMPGAVAGAVLLARGTLTAPGAPAAPGAFGPPVSPGGYGPSATPGARAL